MNMPDLSCLAVAGALLVTHSVAPTHQSRTTFVGTTPCGDVVRAFVGGMPDTADFSYTVTRSGD